MVGRGGQAVAAAVVVVVAAAAVGPSPGVLGAALATVRQSQHLAADRRTTGA